MLRVKCSEMLCLDTVEHPTCRTAQFYFKFMNGTLFYYFACKHVVVVQSLSCLVFVLIQDLYKNLLCTVGTAFLL